MIQKIAFFVAIGIMGYCMGKLGRVLSYKIGTR